VRDSNPVVSEGEMDAGYFGFRHVARYAALSAYAAHSALCVAGETLRVITRSLVIGRGVGIVTGCAGNAAVRGVVALAVREAIGLEANVLDTLRSVDGDFFPGAMTGAAEV
jgi:hypothetical protein